MGLVHLLEAVRATPGVAAIVNATTDKCYLNRERAEGYREDDALGGHDPYSASKACAEIVSASWRSSFLAGGAAGGRPVALATARAGNVVGGGDWGEDRLIPDLVRSATSGQPVAIRYPNATRPWQHVLEPLSGYLMLGARLLADPATDAEAWNFGPDAAGQLSVAQAVAAFSRHWPAARCELDRAAQPHEAGLLHLDCTKARERLGWRPVWDAATTFERTATWYRRQHREGAVTSHADLERYVADARRAGLEWAAARLAEAA
jgi:CDP-glucose 4,6-dehydratase